MNVILDEWTPLFQELEAKVSSSGSQVLLNNCIEAVKESCLSNFGKFANGDMRPWYHEELLSESYKLIVGREFATLERSDGERDRCKDTVWEGGTGAHLKDAWQTTEGEGYVALTNTCDYASLHQLGEGVPCRPFFPLDETEQLMPFMESRIFELADEHFQAL